MPSTASEAELMKTVLDHDRFESLSKEYVGKYVLVYRHVTVFKHSKTRALTTPVLTFKTFTGKTPSAAIRKAGAWLVAQTLTS